jgi:hypothetical protein
MVRERFQLKHIKGNRYAIQALNCQHNREYGYFIGRTDGSVCTNCGEILPPKSSDVGGADAIIR